MTETQAAPRRIRDIDIAAVRAATSISAVIGSYVKLSPTAGTFALPGGNLRGLCPFHAETTPSFNVDRVKNAWYCFGCGAGGDAIDFVMRIEDVPFAAAMERLATRAGIVLRYDEPSAGPQRA